MASALRGETLRGPEGTSSLDCHWRFGGTKIFPLDFLKSYKYSRNIGNILGHFDDCLNLRSPSSLRAKARLKPLNLTPSLQVVAVGSVLPRVLWGSGKEEGLPLLQEPLALQKGNMCNLGKQNKANFPEPESPLLGVGGGGGQWRWLA